MSTPRLFLRLLVLIAPYRGWFAIAVLLGFATVGSSIGLIATSSYLIASAALMPSIAVLSIPIVGVRFFGIARALFRYAERYTAHTATFRLLAGMRGWFYETVEPLAPAGLIDQRGGDLLARAVGDVETLEQFYLRVLAPPLVALLAGLLACGLMLAFDLRLALMLLLLLGLAGLVVPLLVHVLSRRSAGASIAHRAALSTNLVEGVQALDDLLALGREDLLLARVREDSRRLAQAQEHLATVRGLGNGLVLLLSHLAALAMLLLAIPLVRNGELDGVYLALLALTALASFEAVTPLAVALQSLETSLAAARRIFAITDTPAQISNEPATSPEPQDYSLELRNVSFSYPGQSQNVLENLSLRIEAGQQLALIGPSGVGKSTLVQLILRFWEGWSGEILLGGVPLRAYRAEDVRQMIGVVAQHTHLFNGTIADNLRIARPMASQAELDEACRRAHLSDLINRLPNGYDTWIGEQGMKLSGGERQRLAIARALLKDAPILILDEPTAHLDQTTASDVVAALEELRQGRTTLTITHRHEHLASVERIVELYQARCGNDADHPTTKGAES
ncbi:thiol reductant ABC exporter subunit CydC [Candidatus Chloroploca sp. M-50]|uniref:Thiol reductant ABC exporter subunit CydC n=1 Tax=Candidatus Chloroploca mongolica TaxID=2528176 RepID=A0ABS4D768_9CHLR|nr:thiol reductant ABC exporter subunit CydC [Candidatus Chloroploca mongolica]MBP1465250.1 thiol reductant ABC exporter subunit CydC [Candidatus Chloroploca mongolica]